MIFDDEISVANSAVGTDLLDGWEDNQVGYNRYIQSMGLVGAAAAAEEVVSLRVGGKEVDRQRTQATGLAILNTQMLGSRTKVPAGQRIQCIVLTAPTTNPTRLRIVCVP